MKISHGTRIGNINDTNGYGYATVNMIDSLRRLGYHIENNDASADVEIWFDQPQHWKFTPGLYRIGYLPWESTILKPKWLEKVNAVDEIWTPSPIIADWYRRYSGVTVPVYVYEHGVDPVWKPAERKLDGKFNFLHSGAEALRKGGKETMDALRAAFPNNEDVGLTLKVISDGWQIEQIGRVRVINRPLRLEDLIQLYHDHHVYVYPSWGEGFGLTPLQALATGMPTITVPAWAPYADFLIPDLSISSVMDDSPWELHPGKMFRPSFDDLVDCMRHAYDHYEALESEAQANVSKIMEHYSWDNLTQTAFGNLEKRLQSK